MLLHKEITLLKTIHSQLEAEWNVDIETQDPHRLILWQKLGELIEEKQKQQYEWQSKFAFLIRDVGGAPKVHIQPNGSKTWEVLQGTGCISLGDIEVWLASFGDDKFVKSIVAEYKSQKGKANV
jgi:hypothetical protein